MKVSDWIQFASLLGLVLALFFNYLQSRHISRQTEHQAATTKQATLQGLLAFQNGMAEAIFHDPELAAWHLGAKGIVVSSDLEARKIAFIFLRLNAHEGFFLSHRRGELDEQFWIGWKQTIAADFTVEEYRRTWTVARNYYAPAFARFIEELVRPDLKAAPAEA
ncbi:hypothetical protein [Actinoplanes sp. NPDC026619]|uniref:hypothetical protein n=1 Tax=Actinoplanes sp. NPDC026619 TaxID=3155798 RepID=UPI0034020F5C